MALLDTYHLINSDGDLWKKAYAAAFIAATAVIYENPATTNHAARLTWANATRADLAGWVVANKAKILENATILAAGNLATDNDVQFVVDSLVPVAE